MIAVVELWGKDDLVRLGVEHKYIAEGMINLEVFVLSGEEILEFIRTFPEIQPFEWKEESRKRNEFFKQILSDGDRKNLVRMIKTIYRKKTEQNKSKKKINISDETSFKRAEKIIYSEIAAVMNIDYEAVVPFISETISLCHGPS